MGGPVNFHTTFERARAGYDAEHEQSLAIAILEAIAETSRVSDVDCIAIRTAESASALLTVLATILAMSPAATRSPTAMRKTLEELGKRLRRQVASAEGSAELQDFVRRSFRNSDVGGRA
jgi:hypothetical protein